MMNVNISIGVLQGLLLDVLWIILTGWLQWHIHKE